MNSIEEQSPAQRHPKVGWAPGFPPAKSGPVYCSTNNHKTSCKNVNYHSYIVKNVRQKFFSLTVYQLLSKVSSSAADCGESKNESSVISVTDVSAGAELSSGSADHKTKLQLQNNKLKQRLRPETILAYQTVYSQYICQLLIKPDYK